MYRTINLFGIEMSSSILMWGIGIIFSTLFYIIYGIKHNKYSFIKTLLLSIFVLLVEILGAKILYIFENFNYVLINGVGFAGFSLLGIFFSIPLFTFIISKLFKLNFLELIDYFILGVFIELSFYRIGCLLEGCCSGFICDFGLMYQDGNKYFPTPLIESILDLFIFIFLILLKYKDKIKLGDKYLLGVSSYCFIRFILEFTRIRTNLFLNISLSHILCFILFIGHITIYLLRHYYKNKNFNKTSTIISTFLFLIFVPTIFSCDYKNINSNEVLLIYMCGGDLESKYGRASANIEEILNSNIDNNDYVFILTGGSKSWKDESIDDGVNLYKVYQHKLNKIIDYGSVSLGNSSTLNNFITDVFSYLNNELSYNLNLILWDHGNGALEGVCYDEVFNNDNLTLLELKQALNDFKFNYIGFDACLMGCYETCYNLKNITNHIIFSQDLEPSLGWDYKSVVENLGSDDYDLKVLNSFAKKQISTSTYTLSCVDMSKFSILEDYFAKFASSLKNDSSLLSDVLSDCYEYGVKSTFVKSSNLYDFGQCLDICGVNHSFKNIINKVSSSNRLFSEGLNIFFPTDINDVDVYESIFNNDDYKEIINTYHNIENRNTIELLYPLYNNLGTISFMVDDLSLSNVNDVYYCLLDISNTYSNLDYFFIGIDNDITQYDNLFNINFKGNWVFLNDLILYCSYLEKDYIRNKTTFYCPILINSLPRLLLFEYDNVTKISNIIGYCDMDDYSSRIFQFNENDLIYPLYQDLYDEHLYYSEESFLYFNNETTKVTVKRMENGKYQYVVVLNDIYLNYYTVGTVTLNIENNSISYLDIDTTNSGIVN